MDKGQSVRVVANVGTAKAESNLPPSIGAALSQPLDPKASTSALSWRAGESLGSTMTTATESL